MLEILSCFAIIPFIAGRVSVGIVLLVVFWAAEGIFKTGEFSWKGALLGIAAGVLSALIQLAIHHVREWLAAISEAVQSIQRSIDVIIKTLVAMIFAARLLAVALGDRPDDIAVASIDPTALVIVAVGILTFLLATFRARIADVLSEVPLFEESGVQRTFAVTEAVWTVIGLTCALLFPFVGAALAILSVAGLLFVWAVARGVAAAARTPCTSCGVSVHRSAPKCESCSAERTPSQLGSFGRVLAEPVVDAADHRFDLLSARRCPDCAEPLGREGDAVICRRCAAKPFSTADEARAFVQRVDRRVGMTLPLAAAFGFVPVAGLGAALMLYRLGPGGALLGYAPVRDRLVRRALKFMVLLGLSLLQPIPIVGAAAAAGTVGLLHLWSRRSFLTLETTR